MKKQIFITTDNYQLYNLLTSNLPNGVKIISEPPLERRGINFDITLNYDISLVIDLTDILALFFATWLCNQLKRLKGKHEININNEQISVDDPKAIELVTKEIEHKK